MSSKPLVEVFHHNSRGTQPPSGVGDNNDEDELHHDPRRSIEGGQYRSSRYGSLATASNADDDDYNERSPNGLITNSDEASDFQVLDVSPKPNLRFILEFPHRWERALECFDNPLIRLIQSRENRISHYYSLLWTALTNVEIGMPVPFFLFVFGKDNIASLSLYFFLMLAFISQIPKRFLWRTRPYLAGRAKQIRKDRTSSFPSRAVTCAVVYSVFACVAYIESDVSGHTVDYSRSFQWWMPILVIGSALSASYSRIYFGVHYPSDCIAGMIQGLIISGFGQLFYVIDRSGCLRCSELEAPLGDNCYRTGDEAMSWGDMSEMSLGLIIGTAVGCFVWTWLSILKPVVFWKKCHHANGMLFSALLFRLTALCPPHSSNSNSALPPPKEFSGYTFLWSIPFVLISTAIGMKFKGWVSLLGYVLITIAFYMGMLGWRLGL